MQLKYMAEQCNKMQEYMPLVQIIDKIVDELQDIYLDTNIAV